MEEIPASNIFLILFAVIMQMICVITALALRPNGAIFWIGAVVFTAAWAVVIGEQIFSVAAAVLAIIQILMFAETMRKEM